jgi:hypothetical protein
MCWMCDNPEATFADYVDAVVQPVIDRCGWAVQSVGSTGLRAPLSYTVGLSRRGLPELVVTGLSVAASGAVLNAAARLLQHRDPPRPGDLLGVEGRCFEVVDVPHPEAHLFVATGLYGEADVEALQLVWADATQRWRGSGGTAAGAGDNRSWARAHDGHGCDPPVQQNAPPPSASASAGGTSTAGSAPARTSSSPETATGSTSCGRSWTSRTTSWSPPRRTTPRTPRAPCR